MQITFQKLRKLRGGSLVSKCFSGIVHIYHLIAVTIRLHHIVAASYFDFTLCSVISWIYVRNKEKSK